MSNEQSLFDGLQALFSHSFPKQCATCGRVYETAEQYTRETADINGRSGLKAARDDDERVIIELFRNCACGSTLMDCFADRRQTGSGQAARREVFGKILDQLERRGIERNAARQDLLRIMREGSQADIAALLKQSDKNA